MSNSRWSKSIECITINPNQKLFSEPQRVAGIKERTALICVGLRVSIKRESAQRLTRQGGSEPPLQPVPRRSQARMILVETSVWIDHLC
ncbi:MAG: type II toxin-antitoxin system VapB family antitoxin [Pseudomonadota bacterium]|nr:type II toxin-antitoxin system VapB family antitoxin [Pseudomonadota bacterium]